MHSSRMRTVRSSSHVYPSMHSAGRVSTQGVSAQVMRLLGGCLTRGCLCSGVSVRGVSVQGGIAA